jgi:Flp pilus assembly protein TadG
LKAERSESGASAVEFALVLPLLLLILFAIIEFGWFFANRIVLTNAVSDAARAAVKAREWVNEDPVQFAADAFSAACWIADAEDIQRVADAAATDRVDPGKVAFAVTVAESAPRSVQVDAVMGYRSLTGFLPQGEGAQPDGPALLPNIIAARAVMVFP